MPFQDMQKIPFPWKVTQRREIIDSWSISGEELGIIKQKFVKLTCYADNCLYQVNGECLRIGRMPELPFFSCIPRTVSLLFISVVV